MASTKKTKKLKFYLIESLSFTITSISNESYLGVFSS